MLLPIFLGLQVIAIAIFVFSFVKINDYRNWIMAFLATTIFVFLAFQSFNLQTESCSNILTNSTATGGTTNYNYNHSCEINSYVDTNLSYLNIGLGFLSFIYGIGMIFIKDWGIWFK